MKTNLFRSLSHVLTANFVAAYVTTVNVFAQTDDGFGIGGSRPDAAVETPFREAVVGFINYFLTFLGIIAVAFVIYAGILLVTSAGNEENSNKAKKVLMYSGAGIIVILLSFAIVRLIVGAGDVVA